MNTRLTLSHFRGHFKKTALAAAVSAALLGAGPLMADTDRSVQVAQADPIGVFFEEGYSHCDALTLAEFWGDSLEDAKVRAGEKIIDGLNVWNEFLVPALDRYTDSDSLPPEQAAQCYYEANAPQYQFSLQDQLQVACLWQQQYGTGLDQYQSQLVLGWLTAYRDGARIAEILNTECALG